jgi:hypothetical protein
VSNHIEDIEKVQKVVQLVREKLLTAHGQACALALLNPDYPTPEQIVAAKKTGQQIEQTLKAALALL